MNKQRLEIKNLVAQLYKVFKPYDSTKSLDLCRAGYTSEQLKALESVPVSKIDTQLARSLLWEAEDHWWSSNTYKRFLPRILEVMSPPELVEDLFPMHLIEVLQYLDFDSWPDDEKVAVYDFLVYIGPLVYPDTDDYIEFKKGLSVLV